ncbi:MAG: hypothetical protein JXA60_09490 [Candidatus Coatesbacteria bacterium]|nr:hypothetical protein [Candidatus Coatesbacteria bacterium]
MQVQESLLRDIARLIIWYPIRWLVIILPVRWGYRLFDFFGLLHMIASRNKAKKLDLLFTENYGKNSTCNTKKYFKLHYRDRLQIFYFPRFRRSNAWQKIVSIENPSILDECKKKRGIIFLHPHMGLIQLQNFILYSRDLNIMQLGFPDSEELSMIGTNIAFRKRLYYESFIPGGVYSIEHFLRPVIKWLKDGNCILTTGDGQGRKDFRGKYKVFKFLDGYYPFPLGAAKLACFTDSIIIPIFMKEEQDLSYKLVLTEIIKPEDLDYNIERITGVFIKRFENFLVEYPWCWHFWDSVLEKTLFSHDETEIKNTIEEKLNG